MIVKHVAALHVILPLFGGLCSAICYNLTVARFLSIIIITANLFCSLYAFNLPIAYYNFGDWKSPIGIEYLLNSANKPIIIYLNFVLLYFLLFCHKLTNISILEYIKPKYQHLFYAILLFYHVGCMGMVMTNDLFNLYVFIEISSLCVYVLMSLGNNPRSIVGAFDYLIIGSIGASLILIAIGLLFTITGSLNISDIKNIIAANNLYRSNIVLVASAFFIIGVILKIAFFPMHFWMIRAYNYTASIILVYVAGISTIIGVYLYLRFIHDILDYQQLQKILTPVLSLPALVGILISPLLAINVKTLRSTIIYSGVLSICYISFFLVQPEGRQIFFPLLLIDSLNKIGLFILVAYYEDKQYKLKNILSAKYLIVLILVCNLGLPLTPMFIVKLNMLEFLINSNLLPEFFIFIASFGFSLVYTYKMATTLFASFQTDDRIGKQKETKVIAYNLMIIIGLQYLSLIYFSEIKYYKTFDNKAYLGTK